MNSSSRKLVALEEIDVMRDLFDVQFDFYSDVAKDQLEYSVSIKEWTEREISLAFNFTKPLLVSHGPKQDKVFIRFKDETLIRSKETGKPLNTKNAPEFVIIVPS